MIWFLALPYQPFGFSPRTYFSENALLPGLVENEFYPDLDTDALVQEYNAELQKDKNKVPREWVVERFRSLGLDTYIQNYSVVYPLQITRGQSVPGQNVYGILRARRSSSTEAIVLSMPLRQKESDMTSTTGSMVLMLMLARFFRQKPYWAKDIIFLATDHEQFGMQAWLNGYHDISSDYITAGDLMGRSGSIQAAINLEIPDSNLKHMDIKIQGLNGQLPNLDLFNLVVRLCQKEHVDVTIQKQKDYYDAESIDGYTHSLKTMMKMMWSHASGIPTGNHGLFHRYHIEAITIEGVTKRKGHHISLAQTGRVIEGIFRSLNNLLERFHQSFFFYILPATERYISIGLYMPPFGLICAAGLIKAVAIWISLTVNSKGAKAGPPNKDGSTDEPENEKKDGPTKEEKKTKDDSEDEELDEEAQRQGIVTILPLMLFSFLMGVFCYTGPEFVTNVAPPFRIKVEDTVFFGLLALFTACLLLPRTIAKKSQSADKRLIFDWELLKSIGLIFQSLVLFSIALMNISLAFFLAVFLVPVTVIAQPTSKRILRWIQKLLLLLICPAVQIFIASVITTMEGRYSGSWDLLEKSWTSMKHGLLLTIVDRYLFGSWMYGLFCFAILPTWLLFWTIVHCDV